MSYKLTLEERFFILRKIDEEGFTYYFEEYGYDEKLSIIDDEISKFLVALANLRKKVD